MLSSFAWPSKFTGGQRTCLSASTSSLRVLYLPHASFSESFCIGEPGLSPHRAPCMIVAAKFARPFEDQDSEPALCELQHGNIRSLSTRDWVGRSCTLLTMSALAKPSTAPASRTVHSAQHCPKPRHMTRMNTPHTNDLSTGAMCAPRWSKTGRTRDIVSTNACVRGGSSAAVAASDAVSAGKKLRSAMSPCSQLGWAGCGCAKLNSNATADGVGTSERGRPRGA